MLLSLGMLLTHIQEVLILMYDVHIILMFRVTVLKTIVLWKEIEKMIQDGSIMVQKIDSEGSSSHADMQTSG